MEVFVPCDTSRCADISRSGVSSSTTDPQNIIIQTKSKDPSMRDLESCLINLLNIEETRISISGSNQALEKIDIEKCTYNVPSSEKCLSKCATFPPLRGPAYSRDVFAGEKAKPDIDITAEALVSEGNGSAKNMCYSRSISLPVPPKSAMKGSREKQQQQQQQITSSPKKLSVTWAPDVYDPVPTSVSHFPSDKNQRYRSKKYGKYKQKKSGGKSSRGGGSKSKDKKQCRKTSGSSNSKLKQPFLADTGVILGEPRASALDYNAGSPDPFCGTSIILRVSVDKLHYPVAEAT